MKQKCGHHVTHIMATCIECVHDRIAALEAKLAEQQKAIDSFEGWGDRMNDLREKLAEAQAACKRLQRQNSELDTTLSYYELNASGGLPEAMEAACKAARAEGFKEAKRLAIAIVGQRMGYTNAERVIDAIWALDGEENGTLS